VLVDVSILKLDALKRLEAAEKDIAVIKDILLLITHRLTHHQAVAEMLGQKAEE
jgi:hypothetical protein